MPMVNVKITREGATCEQKQQVISEMTEVLQRVLGKNPETTIVIIEEVETDNWGIGGKSVTEIRAKAVS
ncbi:4-oxalocrotonate tautomerase family protein [Alphaproteobacteria bacterium]|jgi:4-oxalocrotonate tautomerase|nr:4-oxalocrotonate tautomerase family protein [Alphaproteobacteria bacterium]